MQKIKTKHLLVPSVVNSEVNSLVHNCTKMLHVSSSIETVEESKMTLEGITLQARSHNLSSNQVIYLYD